MTDGGGMAGRGVWVYAVAATVRREWQAHDCYHGSFGKKFEKQACTSNNRGAVTLSRRDAAHSWPDGKENHNLNLSRSLRLLG
jgi:hypothetical protein